ncbi:hypothetical protein ACJX0J_029765 [Zea mays]
MASGGPALEPLVDQVISVITNDGRNIVGTLRGFDQATNIILDESHERVYSRKEGVQQLVLGLYIIRGDNIRFVVGENERNRTRKHVCIHVLDSSCAYNHHLYGIVVGVRETTSGFILSVIMFFF